MKRPIDGILPTATWEILCDARLLRVELPKSRTHALASFMGKWYVIENASPKKQMEIINNIRELLNI